MRRLFFLVALVAVLNVSDAFAAPPPAPKFESQTIDPEVKIGYGVAVGDVDGDKKLDILLADQKQFVWFRNPGRAGERWPRFVMAENLTELDNVCIAARDIDGDGRVEVAVGAQWNPNETSNLDRSGAIFYLIRPADPTAAWKPVRIEPHDPTVHRMLWIKRNEKKFELAVLPLHGKGNKGGAGTPVRLQIISAPSNPSDAAAAWPSEFVDTQLHMTHNFQVVDNYLGMDVSANIAGREGVRIHYFDGPPATSSPPLRSTRSAGEVRSDGRRLCTISPMHGNQVVWQQPRELMQEARGKHDSGKQVNDDGPPAVMVVDDTLREGHALGLADLLKLGRPQIVAGWRMPNAEKKVGIRLYVPQDAEMQKWATHTIDDNKMACEDLKIADLDGDGRPDIVASGRATHNLVVYWNRTAVGE